MIGYYFRLAFASFRRTPGITTLMVLAIAVGIALGTWAILNDQCERQRRCRARIDKRKIWRERQR